MSVALEWEWRHRGQTFDNSGGGVSDLRLGREWGRGLQDGQGCIKTKEFKIQKTQVVLKWNATKSRATVRDVAERQVPSKMTIPSFG